MGEEYGPEVARLTCCLPGYGRVLLYDDMEGVLKWEKVDRLNWGLGVKSPHAAYQGTYGVQISSWVDEPNGWVWRYGGRSVGLRGHKHVKVSVVFRAPAGIGGKGFRLWVRYYDGTYRWTGSHEYLFQDADSGWHCLSLEVDFHKGVYVGGWCDGVDLGLGGSALSRWPNASPEVLYVIVGVACDIGRPKVAYFDLVLVEEV